MHSKKLPQVLRNVGEGSITVWHGRPKCSLLWLHGNGDNCEGFYSFFTNLLSPVYGGVRVKLLGARGDRWLPFESQQDIIPLNGVAKRPEMIEDNLKMIQENVESECQQLNKLHPSSVVHPRHRVYVGGFGAGGAMALLYSMQNLQPPTGTICLNSWLPPYTNLKNKGKVQHLLINGQYDNVVPQINARKSYGKLLQEEYLTDYRVVEGLGHTVQLSMLKQMHKWIQVTFGVVNKVYKKQKAESK